MCKILSSVLGLFALLLAGVSFAQDSVILDTTHGYTGGCSLTSSSDWTLDNEIQVSTIQVWYNWDSGESTVAYTLTKDGMDFASGTLTRAGCDEYQANWCNGNSAINMAFPPGSYELTLSSSKMCTDGSTGTVRLYGTESSPPPAPPETTPPSPPASTGCGECPSGYTCDKKLDKCVWNPAPATPCEANREDAGVTFSQISGEVQFWPGCDPTEKHFAKLRAPLKIDDHVWTGEDSTATLAFADLSTLILKPESEIVLTTPPDRVSNLQLVLGKIMVNAKKIITGGSLVVRMSNTVTEIKGTQVVFEDDGTVSTIKVIEGTVNVTSTATGETVDVGAGEAVSGTAAGLSPKAAFDVAAEEAGWQPYQQPESSTASDSGSSLCPIPFILAALMGLAFLRSGRR